MCGINGTLGSIEEVKKMNYLTRHRGPDDTGFFEFNGFSIGNNRLSIIDLSPLGHQPMSTRDGRFSIVYNGEIYNFKEIRHLLEKGGVIFRSNSDTEVILEGFSKWGPEITKKLRGMWAFAILDTKENSLFLSRDPFGIKPLYLYDDGKTIAFSSEIKGLLANKKVKNEIEGEVVRQIITLGYPIAPLTIIKDVKSLLPGEEVFINLNTKEKISKISKLETNQKEFLNDNELEEILLDSVEKHLISDVPVGLFFSGGIDSTVLAILLKKLNKKLNAYHVSIEGREDTRFAREISEKLGLNFKEIPLKRELITELFDEMILKMDQPIADTSLLPTMLVSREARKDVKVVLSGEGGDELFGGYLRHKKLSVVEFDTDIKHEPVPVYKLLEKFPSLIKFSNEFDGSLRAIEKFRGNIINLYLLETAIGKSLIDLNFFGKAIEGRLSNRETPDKMLSIDRLIYLPDNLLQKLDVSTMAHSIEGRVPFLDREMFRNIGELPLSWKLKNGVLKSPLKRLISKNLPEKLSNRPKTGFSIPLSKYFFPSHKNDLVDALNWYKNNYTDLIPALDKILMWGSGGHMDVLEKNIGHSLYAINVIHKFSRKNR